MENIYELSENIDTSIFYGVNNANMILLKELHANIRIVARGNLIKLRRH